MTADQAIPALVIDAGALLFPLRHLRGEPRPLARITAQGILDATAAMGCRTLGLAPQDMALGVDFLVQEKEKKRGWLSVNLVGRDGQPLLHPWRLVRLGPTRLAIVGLTDENALDTSRPAGAHLLSWQQALPPVVARLQGKTDMVILLSSYPRGVNERIARQVPGIHLIFQSGHSSDNFKPLQVGNTLICQVGDRGRFLGVMTVEWNQCHQWGPGREAQIRDKVATLDRITWQLERLQNKYTAGQLKTNSFFQELQRKRAQVDEEINALRTYTDKQEPCSYRNRFIALETSLPKDPSVEQIVNRISQQRNAYSRQVFQARHASPASRKVLATMAGWQSCQRCHPAQVEFWRKTGHRLAYETLVRKEHQFDRKCLVCHVTLPGYGKKITRQQLDLLSILPKDLQTVGCESCHGPAAVHARDPEASSPRLPDQQVCVQCHHGEHSGAFNYAKKLSQVRCPRVPAIQDQ